MEAAQAHPSHRGGGGARGEGGEGGGGGAQEAEQGSEELGRGESAGGSRRRLEGLRKQEEDQATESSRRVQDAHAEKGTTSQGGGAPRTGQKRQPRAPARRGEQGVVMN